MSDIIMLDAFFELSQHPRNFCKKAKALSHKNCCRMVNVVMITLEIGGCTDITPMHQWIRRYCDLTRLMAVIAACVSVIGCAPTAVTQQAVNDYQTVASQISIGDAKQYVLSALHTSQQAISAQFKNRQSNI